MSMMELDCSFGSGGRTCLGFNTVSISSLAFVSTSVLSEAETVDRFFAGWMSHGFLDFDIAISPFDCLLLPFRCSVYATFSTGHFVRASWNPA